MKKNKRLFIITIALILALSLSFSAVASARNVQVSSVAGDEDIERGVAWEMLNSLVYEAEGLFVPGNYFTKQYSDALKNYCAYAKRMLDDPRSSAEALNAMCGDMRTIIGEHRHPLNNIVYNCYTVAFTNNGSWSDPIYLYNWSDDGGEIAAWPGIEMTGGYKNEFGQKQYYATVPKDVPNIVISSNSLAADGQYNAVPAVRVQTVDILVTENTGYYLTGEKDGANYKVATWELKAPTYKTFDLTDPIPTEPVTEQLTAAPTVTPTEAPTEKPTVSEQEYELGAVLVSMNSGTPDGLLDGFEIEECRLITPGSATMAVYHVRFKEKTKEIVWRAIEVLRQSPRVKIAEPNYYGSFEVIDDPDPIWIHLAGDADGDGMITVFDATRIQRVLVGYDEDKRQMAETYAAVSGGELSVLDATAIQRYIAGYEDHYGIGAYILPTGLKQSPTEPTTVSHIVYR